MKTIYQKFAWILYLAVVFCFTADGTWAQPGTKDQNPAKPEADHIKDINDSLNRLNTLINRLHTMHQLVEKRLQTDTQSENAAQLRLLQDLDAAIGNVGDHLKATLEKYSILRSDQTALKDALLTQDIANLKEPLLAFTNEMQKAVKTLEEINKKILAKKNK